MYIFFGKLPYNQFQKKLFNNRYKFITVTMKFGKTHKKYKIYISKKK